MAAMPKQYSGYPVTMGNPGGETPDPREQARAAFIDTLVSEVVTLACTAVLFAAVYWRSELLSAARRALAGARRGPAEPGLAAHALTLAQFRAEVSEIDHAPQWPPGLV